MAQKRKDNKGRILKTGESQRKDGSYQYRYKQLDGKWHYAYAPTLEELREKEALEAARLAEEEESGAGEYNSP